MRLRLQPPASGKRSQRPPQTPGRDGPKFLHGEVCRSRGRPAEAAQDCRTVVVLSCSALRFGRRRRA
jgi:hypothetical protein